MKDNYTIAKYRGKWAVLDLLTNVYYFPDKPGKHAAARTAARLNANFNALDKINKKFDLNYE